MITKEKVRSVVAGEKRSTEQSRRPLDVFCPASLDPQTNCLTSFRAVTRRGSDMASRLVHRSRTFCLDRAWPATTERPHAHRDPCHPLVPIASRAVRGAAAPHSPTHSRLLDE